MSSPREREKRDRTDSIVEEMKERDRGERKMNDRNKNIPPLPLPAARIADLAQMQVNMSWTSR